MQMLVSMDTRLVSMDRRITASGVAMDQRFVALDQKIDKIDEKTSKIQENVEALLKSNSSNSSELRMINAELCEIVDATIAVGHPEIRALIDQKRAAAREPV
jgi:septal ring factor EnvC (AmiA/AmiB activator)